MVPRENAVASTQQAVAILGQCLRLKPPAFHVNIQFKAAYVTELRVLPSLLFLKWKPFGCCFAIKNYTRERQDTREHAKAGAQRKHATQLAVDVGHTCGMTAH